MKPVFVIGTLQISMITVSPATEKLQGDEAAVWSHVQAVAALIKDLDTPAAVAQIKDLSLEVRTESTSSQDVTEEYVDLEAEHWHRHDWVRGACLYGLVPANGLTYAPPHSCACYIVAKLNGIDTMPGLSSANGAVASVP